MYRPGTSLPPKHTGIRRNCRNELKYLGIFFFFTAGVSDASELCRRVSKKRKKEKKKRGHSPDTGIRQVVPIPVSDTDMTPKMAYPCNLGFYCQGNEPHGVVWSTPLMSTCVLACGAHTSSHYLTITILAIPFMLFCIINC